MEWIGPLLIGILLLGGVFQLFWAYAISAIAQKTEQSGFMQVLAWIPLLQIAPTLVAGGGSVGRFLVGSTALILGNVALLSVAAFLGDAFGQAVAALGMALTGLLCVFYFGRIGCNTAAARDLPGWMGLLLFIPILNLFVYPYFAFHDGWVGPNKIGLAIGLVLVLSGMAPSFQIVQMMNENESLSPALLMAMSQGQLGKLVADPDLPPGILVKSTDPASKGKPIDFSPSPQQKPSRNEEGEIRALYELKSRFDTLDSLATPENLLIDDRRVRALDIIQTIRTDLEARREMLDASTYGELATHLLGVEARVHSRSAASSTTTAPARRSARMVDSAQFAPAAFDPAARSRIPSYSDASAPPVRPYPVQASDECPDETEMRTRKNPTDEEEWCQQSSEHGGLRHGWYARYDADGRPESMGQYEYGLRVGVWTRFHPTGEVRAQAEFREGLQHGWAMTFSRVGERTRSARFEHGAPVLAK